MREPFVTDVRTRGYECDATRTVPAPVLLSYLEHLRWECMQDPRLGVLDAVHAGHFFVVLEQRLEIVRRVGMGVDLRALAVLEQVGRSTGWVRHVIVRARDGAVVAQARVRGAWMGPDRRLKRIPDAMREVARTQAGALEDLPSPPDTVAEVAGVEADRSWFRPAERVHAARGLSLEAPAEASGDVVDRRSVRPSDLDIFDHVNASRYLGFLDDARARIGLEGQVRRLAIRHHQEARGGDELAVRAAPADGAVSMTVSRGDTLLCAARLELVSVRT